MGKRLQYGRLVWLTTLVASALAALSSRLVYLQVVRHDDLSAKAEQNTHREYILQPRRGDILDSRGNLLATSVFVKTVIADPTLVGNRQAEVARALAPVLEMSENELVKRLTPKVTHVDSTLGITNYSHYVVLKKKVAPETWQKIQALMANLSFGIDEKKLPKTEARFYSTLRQKAIGVESLDDQVRDYPNRSLAAHVLGYTGIQDEIIDGKTVPQTSGKDGIEAWFNKQLAGVRGWRVTEADKRNHELVPWRDQDVDADDGLCVVLTIDSVIQSIVEQALAEAKEKHAPLSISGVVVRPRTGEILAMATLPNYDPNNPGSAPEDARKNRAIADISEPGSTFKIVVVSGALNDGLVRLTDVFDCEHGHFLYAGKVLHDHEAYGALSVQQIIQKSSNIGAAKIGIKMGEQRLDDYIRSFGFGVATGIPLPGEVSAKPFVPRVKDWSKLSIARIPMGQGISTTRLQMIMAMCAIANKGVLMRPMLVDRLQDRDGNVVAKYVPQRVHPVISEAAAKDMVTALKTVVSAEGTAPKAAMEHFTVAGKTGTAQKAAGGIYQHGKYFSSFIGFFPADNPELCISITLDEPQHGYYGGQAAAPTFKEIADAVARYLGIPPEDGVSAESTTLAEPNAKASGASLPNDNLPLKTASARTP